MEFLGIVLVIPSLMIRARSRALSTQAQVLIDDELADARVAGSEDGKANDDS